MGHFYLSEDLIIATSVVVFAIIKILFIIVCWIQCCRQNKERGDGLIELQVIPLPPPNVDISNDRQMSLIIPRCDPQNISRESSFRSTKSNPPYQTVIPKSQRTKQTNYVNVQINPNLK